MVHETATDFDYGPLSWVKAEIDQAMQRALDALGAVARASGGQTSLQQSQTFFHQAAGALQIVGLDGVTPYTDEIERQLSRLSGLDAAQSEGAIPVIEHAVQRLQSYLDELVNGVPAVPLKLFPEYQALQQLRGVAATSPTDLFFPDLTQRPPKSETVMHIPQERMVSYLVRQRRQFQQGLLGWLRGQRTGAETMRQAVQAIEDAQTLPGQRAFWWSVGGLLERLEAHPSEINHAIKLLCARIDLQIRRLIEGSNKVADRLRREVLYSIALSPSQGKRVDAVRATYRLAALLPPASAATADAPQLQPVLRECRELLAAAKDAWLKFTAGRPDSYASLLHSMQALKEAVDSLGASPLQSLLGALAGMVSALPRPGSGKPINETLAMEYATGLLLAESALGNFSGLSPELPQQVDAMLQRLDFAARDLPPPPDATARPLLDDMARKVQERLLLSNVVREIQVNLRHVEQVLDAFFRDHARREELATLSGSVRQIQGALRILGLDKADELLAHCQAQIDAYADPERAVLDDDLESLAESLSGFGFYIDAVSQHRGDADTFIDRLLRKRLGIPEEPPAIDLDTVEEGLRDQREQLTPLLDALQQQPQDTGVRAELKQQLEAVKQDAELVADAKLSEQTATALSLLQATTPDSHAALSETIQAIADSKSGVAPTPPPSEETMRLLSASGETLDAELLEIYLAEADEVLNAVSQNLALCRSESHNVEALRTIRRGFHTLKGSGRMVGLHDLGEQAWGVERRMNGWLEEERHASPVMLAMIDVAQNAFRDWIGQLQATGRVQADTSALEAALAAVDEALGGHVPPPVPPAENAAEGVEEAPVASASSPEVLAEPASEGDAPALSDSVLSIDLLPKFPLTEEATAGGEISIGEVRLSPSLHGILTEEAQQHVVTLKGELALLQFDPYTRPSDLMVRAAHTLCGIHRTSGFPEVAETAYALEQALLVLQHAVAPVAERALSALALSIDVLDVLVGRIHALQPFASHDLDAAAQARERLRELTGAAADVRADSETLAAHRALVEEEMGVTEIEVLPPLDLDSGSESTSAPGREGSVLNVIATAATAAVTGLAAVAVPAATQPPVPIPIVASAAEAAAPTAAPTPVEPLAQAHEAEVIALSPAPERTTQAAAEAEATAPVLAEALADVGVITTLGADPLAGIRDDVDEQLLPVFLEEAHELFPQASKQLRAWRKYPSDVEAPYALQRTLHTFKGSARMAGAMRLGQLTHLMESRLLAGDRIVQPTAELFDVLDSDLDQLAFILDHLQKSEFDVALPRYVAAPVAPAVHETDVTHAGIEAIEVPAAITVERAVASEVAPEPAVPAELAAGILPAAEAMPRALLRVRADVIDRLANEAGEVSISRARVEGELRALKSNLLELTNSVIRLRNQVREIEIQAESQIQSTLSAMRDDETAFDPLEFDRYTRFQELARSLTEGVNDVSTIQQALLKNLDDADAALLVQGRLNRDVQQTLLSVRTVPFGSLSERLYRIMRQVAKELDKKANLEISGAQVELDRSVLEKMVGPLEHLLRNALDHGIERSEARLAAGKPEIGEIALSLRQEGNEVVLLLSDDGAGLNFARIRERAERLELIPAGVEPTEAQLIECTFAPGFSTAVEVTQISGRGVGMDVVRNTIESLGGHVEVASVAGKGTTFTLYLPLTLAVAQAVLVRAGGRLYALPSPLVEQVQQVKAEALINLYVAHVVLWQGRSYPFFYLPRLMGDQGHNPDTLRYNSVLLLRSGAQYGAVHVDQMLGNQEVVMKNIGTQLARVPGITGATVLGSGEVVLIINPVQLVPRAEAAPRESMPVAPIVAAAPEKMGLIMVVDDSLTVRKVTSRLLLREGYEVATAKDGVDGLQALNEALPDVILLDIEMPRMDGFEFAKTVRNDPRSKHIPIIMITSRTAEKHRERARELGVEVYLGKPYQEEELLGHIKSLIV